MEKRNVLFEKSYAFTLRIVKLYKYLSSEKKEYVLSKQLLRSGISIGANIEEAMGGLSKADFRVSCLYPIKKQENPTFGLGC